MTAPIQHPISVADVLDRAADRVVQGCGQGSYFPKSGCVCALAAIAQAAGVEPSGNWSLYDKALAYEAATAAFGGVNETVVFNDRPGRKQSEVEAALRSAATAVRQEQSHEA